MENISKYSENTSTYKIELLPEDTKLIAGWENHPHFFIKVDNLEERYRLSASFKYLNLTWDLKINIIRDTLKIPANKLLILKNNKFTFNQDIISSRDIKYDARNDISEIEIERLYDSKNNTIIFIITRNHKQSSNTTIAFFSKNFWKIDKYLEEFNTSGAFNITKGQK